MEELVIELGPELALRLATLVKDGGIGWQTAIIATLASALAWYLRRRRRSK